MTEENNLHRFGAYRKALELFDHVVNDLTPLPKRPELHRIVAQQFASADSVAANQEEGYGRASRREYAQFLVIARGSAQETRGRYRRFRHWLPEATVGARVALCEEIVAILSKTIQTLRK